MNNAVLLDFISYSTDLEIQGILILGFALFLLWLYFTAEENNEL